MLGTCAGAILLSSHIRDGRADQHCLGAIDIVTRRNAFGRQVDSFEQDLRYAGWAEPVRAVFIRAPWVEQVGESVEVLASVQRDGAAHPVAVRLDGLLATSFHPEVTGDLRVHKSFVAMVRERG